MAVSNASFQKQSNILPYTFLFLFFSQVDEMKFLSQI